MPAGFLGTILDRTGERIRERIAYSDNMDNEMRKAKADIILKAIAAVDENGNPKMDQNQREEALKEYESLYKHNKNAKEIIGKARGVFDHIFGMGGKPNPAMAGRATSQMQGAMEGGQGGTLVGAPSVQAEAAPPAAKGDMSDAETMQDGAQPMPYTPPPPVRSLPVQEVAAAASTQPAPVAQAQAFTPPPPPRSNAMSMAQMTAAAAPNPIKNKIAEEGRAVTEWDRQAAAKSKEWEAQQQIQHKDRLEEIEAQKKDPLDKEIDTYTNRDGFRVTTFQKADGKGTYTVTSTQKAMDTSADKSLQAKEVQYLDGHHGGAMFNPDPNATVKWTNLQGEDITNKIKGEYFQPSASIQMLNQGLGGVDAYVNMANTGQIRSITEVPQFIRTEVVKKMNEQGVKFQPPSIRERKVAIETARNLITPIEDLINKINAAPNLEDKIALSYALETYTGSVSTLLSRSMGERGVVTEGDVTRSSGLVPGWKAVNFAPGFANEQLDRLKGIMDSQYSALDTYFKEDTKLGGGGAKGGAPAGTIKMVGPDGKVFNVPVAEQKRFEANKFKVQ